MKRKVAAPLMKSAAVVLSVSVPNSIAPAPAEDLSKAASSQLDASRLTYARLYCTPDNESHFGEQTAELAKQNFAPPAASIYIGGDQPASRVFFAGSRRTGALPTWRTVSTIPLPQFSCLLWPRVYSRSRRQMERRGNYIPATWST
jgi:hypothetical protein